ncbi:MAG TPA: ATP-binding cassette domain-containing protein [Firmicutes bacterium]|nr:ATP-binding cassette domain-containing protein [Bacillota bacterium]
MADMRGRAAFAVEAIHLRKEFPKRHTRLSVWGLWMRREGRDGQTGRNGSCRQVVVAVRDVSFAVQPGEVFGLLGPNGAGKTTTIRMLCTLLEPTSGSATVNGYDTVREAPMVRRSLGTVLTGERSTYWKLTGRENLEYFAALYGLSRKEQRARATAILERLGLADKADQLVETYSSGMKQRLALGRALLAGQPILLLDEPTIGLDPAAARSIRELIRELRAEGRTILLTTHYMEEADQLCDRVAIIDQGSIIALDSPRRLKDSLGEGTSLQLEVSDWNDDASRSVSAIRGVAGITSRYAAEQEAWQVSVVTDNGPVVLAEIIAVLARSGVRIRRVQAVEPTLEDVFLKLTGKGLKS